MKRYTDPELEIVKFEITDVTNTDDGGEDLGGENEVPFDDIGGLSKENGVNPSIQIHW